MFSKKFSSNLKKRRRALASIIVIFALTLGLGYAVFGSNLNFLGGLSLNAKTLNVYVKSVTPTSGSVTPTSPAEIKGNERKEVDFSTNLPTLTDYYEVSTVIRNGGKSKAYYIDYELKVYDANGDEITLPSELEVTVLNNNGTSIVQNHELNAASEETFKIKFNYKSGASLPSTQPIYTIKVVFNYDLEPYVCQVNNKLYNVIKCEAEDGGLAAKYTGNHNDTLDNSGTEDIYYYTGDVREKFNVKLGNMCFQMLRTTDTGGVKLIYNGEINATTQCGRYRGHRGVIGTRGEVQNLTGKTYMYGDTYSYDLATGEFTLENTSTVTWSDATADSLVGRYTCKNQSNTCTTLYGIGGYYNVTTAYVTSYTIKTASYATIGTTPFNANPYSPAMVGYMFNKASYYYKDDAAPTSGSLMGNDVKYENGEYILLPAEGESELSTTKNNTHHYTCNNTTGICQTVRYYYYQNYYLELTGGTKIEDAVHEMLYDDNVNTKNSNIKTLIEAWYKQNMTSYTNMLEDVIYCNDRTQENADTGPYNKNGDLNSAMFFKNYSLNDDLSCTNITDRFTTANTKAKLEYPVGLITSPEMKLLNDDNSRYIESIYWLGSPCAYDPNLNSYVRIINATSVDKGTIDMRIADINYGVRPAISLKPGTEYTSGTGTMNDPYVVKLD